MGDSVPGNETYNRANGLTDDETSDLKNWFSSKNDASGPDEIDNLEQNFNYRGGNFTVHVVQIIKGKTSLWGELIDGNA